MSSSTWHRVTNVRAFLESRGKVSVGAHQPRHIKRLPWPCCARCGLLYLKNDATAKATREPCRVEED